MFSDDTKNKIKNIKGEHDNIVISIDKYYENYRNLIMQCLKELKLDDLVTESSTNKHGVLKPFFIETNLKMPYKVMFFSIRRDGFPSQKPTFTDVCSKDYEKFEDMMIELSKAFVPYISRGRKAV